MNRSKRIRLLLLILTIAITMAGCAAGGRETATTTGAASWDSNIEGDFIEEEAMETETGSPQADGEKAAGSPILIADPERKLVVRTGLELETTDFDTVVD